MRLMRIRPDYVCVCEWRRGRNVYLVWLRKGGRRTEAGVGGRLHPGGEQVEWERGKEGKQVMLGSPGRVSGQPEAAAGSWYLRPLSSSSSCCCSLQSGVPAGRQRTGSTGL